MLNSNKDDRDEFKISLGDLELYAAYIVKSISQNNRSTLVVLRDLLSKINPFTTYGEGEKKSINTFLFVVNMTNGRLDENIRDKDILINFALSKVDATNVMDLTKLDRPLTVNELNIIEANIHSTYENFYMIISMREMNDLWMQYITNTNSNYRKNVLHKAKESLNKINKASRKATVASDTQRFSLDDESFTQTVDKVYERNCNPSTKLKTGMVSFNRSLAGGFENGRVYVYLGLPGEGKSTTLLNIGLQLKQNNTHYRTKDKTKRPCILFLTMENSLDETIERIFNILITEGNMSSYESSMDVKKILMQNGLAITEDSPIDFVIQYVPANTVNTDYLYTIYDQLLDEGKECICVIQDYIKRIRSRDFKLLKGDMRLGLGAVIDEFKEFAITKQIPVITASQMNREATSKVDDGRKNKSVDLVRNLGRNNIGESLLILENADAAFIITPETTKWGRKYLGVSSIKTRFKGATLFTFFQPYNKDRPIELEQDTNLAEPLYRDTLVEMQQTNTTNFDKNSLDKSDTEEIEAGIKQAEEEAKKKEQKNLFNKTKKANQVLDQLDIKNEREASSITKDKILDPSIRNGIFNTGKVKCSFIITPPVIKRSAFKLE